MQTFKYSVQSTCLYNLLYSERAKVYIFFFLPKNKLLAINFHLIISEFFLSGKKGDSKSSSTESVREFGF